MDRNFTPIQQGDIQKLEDEDWTFLRNDSTAPLGQANTMYPDAATAVPGSEYAPTVGGNNPWAPSVAGDVKLEDEINWDDVRNYNQAPLGQSNMMNHAATAVPGSQYAPTIGGNNPWAPSVNGAQFEVAASRYEGYGTESNWSDNGTLIPETVFGGMRIKSEEEDTDMQIKAEIEDEESDTDSVKTVVPAASHNGHHFGSLAIRSGNPAGVAAPPLPQAPALPSYRAGTMVRSKYEAPAGGYSPHVQPTEVNGVVVRFPYISGNPPGDLSADEWGKAYNTADTQVYRKHKDNKSKSKAARERGETRVRAIQNLIKKGRLAGDFVDNNP